MTTAAAASATARASRLAAVDVLRGSVMVLMALDHTRDFIHAGAMSFSPEDLARTTPALFVTRWVTHVCAPTFMLLAGVAARLRLERTGSRAELARFLWTRGLWLVFVELTVMRLAMNFSFDLRNPVLLLVLTALGLSMIVLSAMMHLPQRLLLALSVSVILLHNLLDGIQPSAFGTLAPVWNIVHQPGAFVVAGVPVVVGYPLVPWFAVMAAGFCLGGTLARGAERRTRALMIAGLAVTLAFLVVRSLNSYGDPAPWSPQASRAMSIVSFLRTTKYPPSLQFLLMTLGPAMVALAWVSGRHGPVHRALATIGRVPFFFYVVHFWALHAIASLLAYLRYGRASLSFLLLPLPSMGGPRELFPTDFGYPLWTVYAVWIGIVTLLYPACRWFAGVKARRRDWWLGYF